MQFDELLQLQHKLQGPLDGLFFTVLVETKHCLLELILSIQLACFCESKESFFHRFITSPLFQRLSESIKKIPEFVACSPSGKGNDDQDIDSPVLEGLIAFSELDSLLAGQHPKESLLGCLDELG